MHNIASLTPLRALLSEPSSQSPPLRAFLSEPSSQSPPLRALLSEPSSQSPSLRALLVLPQNHVASIMVSLTYFNPPPPPNRNHIPPLSSYPFPPTLPPPIFSVPPFPRISKYFATSAPVVMRYISVWRHGSGISEEGLVTLL